MQTITDFEVLNHGRHLPDYFPGCGVAFTRWTHVATGCGDDAKGALDDALEQLAEQGLALLPEVEAEHMRQLVGVGPDEAAQDSRAYVSVRCVLPGEAPQG